MIEAGPSRSDNAQVHRLSELAERGSERSLRKRKAVREGMVQESKGALPGLYPFATIQMIAYSQAREGDKQMAEQETTGIGWFIAGLGLGALLGVLFAPKAGKELREGLITSAKDSKEYVASRSREARDQINSVVDRSRNQINEFTERGREVAEKSRERWSGIVDRVGGNKVDAERNSVPRDIEEDFHGGAAENRF